MTQTRRQSIFPNLPRDNQVSEEEGGITEHWRLHFDQLTNALQANFKTEGIVFPALDDTQIAYIQSLYTPFVGIAYQEMLKKLPDISGQTIFDSTNRVPKQFIITFTGSPAIINFAAWKTFTLT